VKIITRTKVQKVHYPFVYLSKHSIHARTVSYYFFFIDIQQVNQGEREREIQRESMLSWLSPILIRIHCGSWLIANNTKFAWLIMILPLLSQQIWIKNVNSLPPPFSTNGQRMWKRTESAGLVLSMLNSLSTASNVCIFPQLTWNWIMSCLLFFILMGSWI
jgi:hypothetical protein